MLRYGVNRWQNIGIQQPMDGSFASKAVDDETIAAIVLKWQQYLRESGIASSDVTQNHVTSFITHCSGDLDKMLAMYINNPQMGKSLVRTIISNHDKKNAPDGSLVISMSEIDEDLEDIRTAEDQYVNSLLSDSTTDLAMAQRQRVGSFSSASTNITSKYDHLASMLRTDTVKHSFYGSPERDESPLVSPTVSELPSPETSVSRKHLSSIDEIDAEYLQETDRSTVEVLEWSNGLHGFRKAAPAAEIDHSTHDFRFLHPMNKPLFPPGYVYTHNHHAPLRERSPVRSTSGIGSLGQKLFTSPPRHSPSRVVLPTIAESDAASGRSDSAPKFAPEASTDAPVDVKDSTPNEMSVQTEINEVNEGLSQNKTKNISDASAHTFRFPEVVYESSSAPMATKEPPQQRSLAINNHVSEGELDDGSVGSSLSAASTASTAVSNSSTNSDKYKLLYLSATNELLRRKLQRKQKQAKKRKPLASTKAQNDRETVKNTPAAVFCSPVKEGNNEKEETNEAEEVEIESDSASVFTTVTATASHDTLSSPHRESLPAQTDAPRHVAGEPRSTTIGTPANSPHKSGATRHKAENELTFKVARFLLPFLIAIVLYVGGRYYYKTQVLNIWQNQQRLTDNAPSPPRSDSLLHRRPAQSPPPHTAPSAATSAKTKDSRDNYDHKASPSPPQASFVSTPTFSSPAEPLYAALPNDEDLHQGSLSLHVSIRGLDGRAYSPGSQGQQRASRGGPSTVATIYSGQFSAFRHAWVRIRGVFAAAVRTVTAPVHGLFSIFSRR